MSGEKGKKPGAGSFQKTDEMGFGGLKIYQSETAFRYGVDAVILADFAAKTCKDARSFVDLGAGNGAVSLILSHKLPRARGEAVEVQEGAAELARENVKLNGLEERIEVIQADIRDLFADPAILKAGAYDLVVSNPPYFKNSGRMTSNDGSAAIARHEIMGGLEDFIAAAEALLRSRGDLCMIHRPARLTDLLTLGRKYRLEPKDMRLIAPRAGSHFNLALLRFTRDGGSELKVWEPLYVYEGEGYSDEIMRIYEREQEL